MTLTELSIKRPSFIIVIFIVLAVLGIYSYSKLSYELIPKFSAPVVIINTIYPGAGPSEVENSISKPIEDAVSSIENIVNIRSGSREGISIVTVELEQGANVDKAIADAQRKINAIASAFPEQAKAPIISKFSSDETPIMNIGATAKMDDEAFYDLMKDRVKPALSRIQGVGQINLFGGQEREVQVNVNATSLLNYNLTILQVVQAIQQANLDFPTGKLKNDREQIIIRLAGKFNSVAELNDLVVATNPYTKSPIKLREIAEIVDTHKEINDISRVNGNNSIGVFIFKTSDANAVAVSDGIKVEVKKLEKLFQDKGLKFQIANNTTDFTINAVDAVIHDLLIAILLVALVMLFFLHSFRNALIVMFSIPTSLVATFILMYLFDFTLNLMTLLAMSLVVGILVDDSIVVLENIYRHLEMGKNPYKAALEGRNEIGFTALAITLVDVVVFFPISLTEGIVGNIMRQFCLVVVFSTLMSLFVSFTITPMLASRFSKVENLNPKSLLGAIFMGFERIVYKLINAYSGALAWSLKHKRWTFVMIVALFFTVMLLPANGYIGSAFIQRSDRGEFIIKLELAKDATLKETNLATQKVEALLFSKTEVTGVFATVGITSGIISSQNSNNLSEINVKLLPKEKRNYRAEDYARLIKQELVPLLPGVKVTTSEVSFFGGADEDPIQLIFSGSDRDSVMKYANATLPVIAKVKGILEPKLSIDEANPEVRISVDRAKMADLGLNMATVGSTMQISFSGNSNLKYAEGTKEYDINIKLDGADRKSLENISNQTFMNSSGVLIRLSQFATIAQATGPSQLERKDRISSVVLKSKVMGRPEGDVGNELRKLFKENPPPVGININYDGNMKNQEQGFGSLGLAFLASILFVYLIMVALYDSWIYPIVAWASIPVAMIGAFLAMALTMSTLDIFSILGIIMLIGLVMKNAILLVDFANQMKEDGMGSYEALIMSGRTRLRPILMTTLAMVIGMLPIALGKGAGAEWKNGLAWALIGGLSSSMILTLFIVPIMYLSFDIIGVKLRKLFNIQPKAKIVLDDDM